MMMMTMLWFTAFSVGVPPLPPSDVTASHLARSCPPDHELARVRIGNVLNSPLLPKIRARFDLGTASADDIRLLNNRQDREACAALWDALEANGTSLSPTDAVSFYQSGDVYFIPVTLRPQLPPGVVRLDGGSSLQVYDASFRLIGRFSA